MACTSSTERAIHRAEADELADAGVVIARHDRGSAPRSSGPYVDAGYDMPDVLVDAVPAGGMAASRSPGRPAPATRLLAEGDVIDLGDRAFEVLHLPGHSPGSIGLWEPATGVLFSGDAIYDGPLLDELDGCDIAAYVATMRRLRELPVTVVHGGHEPSFGRGRLVELCDALPPGAFLNLGSRIVTTPARFARGLRWPGPPELRRNTKSGGAGSDRMRAPILTEEPT